MAGTYEGMFDGFDDFRSSEGTTTAPASTTVGTSDKKSDGVDEGTSDGNGRDFPINGVTSDV